MTSNAWIGVLLGTALVASAGAKAEPVRIGMITTLSGGGSSLGIDVRDGFMLAMEEEGGTLGGQEIELLVEDDAMQPDTAKQIADRLIKRDEVDILTGIIWSNLALAVVPSAVADGVFYISPNAGPSQLAGRACHENYFNVAWQNDNLHEAMGQYVSDNGFANAYVLAPNYPAGKDALAGFKRFYKGDLAGETYTQLGQTDYAAEIAAIREAGPDSIFFFLPGGMGIAFMKQYAQSGLDVPVFGPAFSFSQDILAAMGDAALGVKNTSQWSKDLDNPANAAVRRGLPGGLRPPAVALRQPGLRCGAAARLGARQGLDRRSGRVPRGAGGGRVRIGARRFRRSAPTIIRSRTSTCARWSRKATS